MKTIGKEKLNNFKRKHSNASSQIDSWIAEVEEATWNTPQDIKRRYASASILANYNVVFNLKGNSYRLLVQVNYKNKIVLVKKVGTHKDYETWQL
jgi:mRNA interferase HigB